MAMVMTGGCLISSIASIREPGGRQSATREATIVHCLGVMPTMLMGFRSIAARTRTHVRFAFAPGPDPRLHAAAEERFGIPIIDGWAMTETGTGAPSSPARSRAWSDSMLRPRPTVHAGAHRR